MNSKRIGPPRSRARRTTVQARQRVPNPFPLATRRLAKRILQFAELPKTERTRAFNTWLNSAGSPKRNAVRQTRVRDFYRLIQAIAEKLSSRDRASLRALGIEILAKGTRKTASKPKA